MHEASVVRSLLRRVEEIVRDHDASRAAGLTVTVGEFSGVEPALLQSAFERESPGTRAAGARFVVRIVPLEARCGTCGADFRVERFRFVCPTCGAGGVRVTRGEELQLEDVTLEAET